MNCYACESAAANACKRCARPFCDSHGNGIYCGECLEPASALPSFNLYRAALLAMLVGTAVAVVLIIRPPGETKGAPSAIVGGLTPTPTPSDDGGAAPTVAPETPEADETPQQTATTAPTTSPAPPADTPTPPPPPPAQNIEYVVQEGDTLFGIAEAYLPPGADLNTFVNAIASLNGLDPVEPGLSVGQTLLIPNAP